MKSRWFHSRTVAVMCASILRAEGFHTSVHFDDHSGKVCVTWWTPTEPTEGTDR